MSLAGGGNNSLLGPGGVIPGALELFGDVSNILNPDAKVSPLGVLGTVIKGVNLAQNAKGITRESLRAEGYKILQGTLRNVARGSLNGLGVNLNLNKGSNFATSGQFLGTPVAVVTAAAIGQEFGGITTQPTTANGTVPTSSNPSTVGASRTSQINQTKAVLNDSQYVGSENDTTTDGTTAAAGTYFTGPEDLIDTQPFERADIDDFSAPEDIEAALEDLNSSWATDNDFVAGQSPNTDEISQRLNDATSYEEYAAIKADADLALERTRTVQQSVDTKYQAEYNRLNALLQQARSNVSGASTLGGADVGPTGPSIESQSLPDIEF